MGKSYFKVLLDFFQKIAGCKGRALLALRRVRNTFCRTAGVKGVPPPPDLARSEHSLLSHRFSKRDRKLVCAGCRLKSACVSFKKVCNLKSLFTFHKCGYCLEISVATALKGYVMQNSVLYYKCDLRSTSASCSVLIFHFILLSPRFLLQ